jgi:hypothetical protein
MELIEYFNFNFSSILDYNTHYVESEIMFDLTCVHRANNVDQLVSAWS